MRLRTSPSLHEARIRGSPRIRWRSIARRSSGSESQGTTSGCSLRASSRVRPNRRLRVGTYARAGADELGPANRRARRGRQLRLLATATPAHTRSPRRPGRVRLTIRPDTRPRLPRQPSDPRRTVGTSAPGPATAASRRAARRSRPTPRRTRRPRIAARACANLNRTSVASVTRRHRRSGTCPLP